MLFGKVINIHVCILLFVFFFKYVMIRIYIILLKIRLNIKYSAMHYLGENSDVPLNQTVAAPAGPSLAFRLCTDSQIE